MGGGKKKSLGTNKGSASTDGSDSKQPKKEEVRKSTGKIQQKQKLSILIEESQGRKVVQNMKAITIQGIARASGVKISVANSYLRSLEIKGLVKSVGGYSGHRVYKLSESF